MSAKALHRLTKRSPQYVAQEIIPTLFGLTDSIDINTRHGSIIALGEVTAALKELERDQGSSFLTPDALEKLNGLVLKFFDRDQFRGMSGEIMKQGCADFIQNCSKARIEADEKCLETWQSFIDKCLVNKNIVVREGATRAFEAVCNAYYSHDTEQRKENNLRIIDFYLGGCRNDLEEHIRMGYLMAVGAFPKFMYLLKLEKIIGTLIKQSQVPNYTENPGENTVTRTWSEARRDSVKALTTLAVTVGADDLTELQLRSIFDCFLAGLEEYTSDNRGDIGAWVREASMKGLYPLSIMCAALPVLDPELMHRIMCGLARQSVEKIDRTRGLAGKLFCMLVHHSDPSLPHIKRHDELKTIFPENPETILWLFADNTFPLFCSLLQFEEYSSTIILGLTASTGQLSESLVSLRLISDVLVVDYCSGVYYCNGIYPGRGGSKDWLGEDGNFKN